MKALKDKFNTAFILLLILFSWTTGTEAIPEIQSWQSTNGGKVLFIETQALPMVDVKLIFAGGSARDGQLPGVALLTNTLLASGAGDWDADEIAEQLDGIGAVLTTDSARDMALVNLRTLSDKDKLQQALAIMQTVISRPQFNPSDLIRDKRRLLAMLQHKQQQPSTVAADAFNELLYGSHPYAHPSEGREQSINAISRDELLAFHRQYYVARNAVLALVGDLSRAEAVAIAEQLLTALPAGEPAPALPEVRIPEAPQLRKISMPITQTHILLGQPVIARGDPDYFPLYVGNHILGGSGFGSRLMDEIREQRGLAYDTRSYFLPMAAAGPFRATVETRNEQADEAHRLLLDAVKRFVAEGPDEEELNHAIQNITGSFPMQVDSNSDLIGYIGMMGFYNYPLDHLQTFTSRIRAVTVEQIRDAFQRRLSPENFVTVIVGGSVSE